MTSFDKAPDRVSVLTTKNGQEFYSSLRLVISPYNIPLVDWSQITDAKNILDLDPVTTGNYVSARQVMACVLYRFFDRHKEEIFDRTTHFADALVSYEKSLDGIGFLSDIVALRHPHVVKSAYHSNTTIEAITMPTYSPNIGLFTFIRDRERYFDANPGKTFLFQTTFVKESLEKDPRFADVISILISQLKPYIERNTGFLPRELQLCGLSSFFQNNMKPDALANVCRPDGTSATSATINAVHANNGRYNEKKTRFQDQERKPYQRNRNKIVVEDVTDDEGESSGPTKLCSGCGGYGHTKDECKAIGKIIHINEWLKGLSSQQRREFLTAYKRDKLETHKRYLAGLKSRKLLKLKINRLQYDASHNMGLQLYDASLNDQIENEIKEAHERDPNIDFGSADLTYSDLNEMSQILVTFQTFLNWSDPLQVPLHSVLLLTMRTKFGWIILFMPSMTIYHAINVINLSLLLHWMRYLLLNHVLLISQKKILNYQMMTFHPIKLSCDLFIMSRFALLNYGDPLQKLQRSP